MSWMGKLAQIFMRNAVAGIDTLSSFLNARGAEPLGHMIDRRNRLWAQKVPVQNLDDFKMSCYHEAGEALIQNYLFPKYSTTKICMIEASDAYGYSFDDMHKMGSRTRTQFIHQMASMFGGYCAEKLIYGETTEGCEEDFDDIREIVKDMIQRYKMADELIGPIELKTKTSFSIMGFDVFSHIDLREMKLTKSQQQKYEQYSKGIMNEAENLAASILLQNKDELDGLAEKLMEMRILLTDEIADIWEPMSRDPA